MSNVNNLMAQVREGMDIYCSDGEKVGSVGDINIGTTSEVISTTVAEEQNFLQIKRGFLGLGNDLWVAGSDVQDVSEDRVTLRCSKDELATIAHDDMPTPPGQGGGNQQSGADAANTAGAIGFTRGPGTTGSTTGPVV
jgi:hypothetical protein